MEELKKENSAKLFAMMTSLKEVRAEFTEKAAQKETELSHKEEAWATKEKEFTLKLTEQKVVEVKP